MSKYIKALPFRVEYKDSLKSADLVIFAGFNSQNTGSLFTKNGLYYNTASGCEVKIVNKKIHSENSKATFAEDNGYILFCLSGFIVKKDYLF